MYRNFYTVLCFVLLTLLSKHGTSQSLVHYWNFNTSGTEAELLAPSVSLTPGAAIEHIPGPESAIQITSNTGQGFDASNLNARNGDESATHLRFNTPIGGTLIISLPTTGYQQIVVKYATRRSGSGAGTQTIEYSVDGINYIPFTTIDPVDGDPTLQTLDFSGITEVNDNDAFKISITFSQGPGGLVGNNRFDNLTLDGIQDGDDTFPPVAAFFPTNNSIDVSPDVQPSITFNEGIRLTDDTPIIDDVIPSIVELREDSLTGLAVAFTGTISNNTISITPSAALANGKQYFLILLPGVIEDTSNNAIVDQQFTSFTTIVPQTVFQAGDIVPIAYRMNAEGADDEVAFLTLVPILPGTKINMADAKYTDNAQPQCPGGITWTSPTSIIAPGTVIMIGNDNGVANLGTITGSTFGLSSNGDQMIVYTGTAAAPQHITALSSNAWVTDAHTACGGSLSKLPAGLIDGEHAINLSTAPGNTAGNTVNAYYNGIQTGTDAELKAAILNPANWIGIEGGMAPQVWPDYNFPGPPSIETARVINQTTLELVFNSDMDPISTADLSHYTGIDGLQEALQTDNGTLGDTITLVYTTPFENGNTYTLFVEGVQDLEGRSLLGVYEFTFTYSTTLRFDNRFISVSEEAGTAIVELSLAFPSDASINVSYNANTAGTATPGSDFETSIQQISFTGQSVADVTLSIPIIDDALAEQDEYFTINLTDANGLQILGAPFYTVYIRDNDRQAPEATEDIQLEFISRYAVDNPDEVVGLAEIVAFDGVSERLFTISTALKQFDIVDFSDPINPTNISKINISAYGAGITSVAVKNGVVGVTVTGLNNEQENGSVLFYDTDGNFIKQVTAGALPDMITFTPDGNYVLTANEGQPDDSYQNDPEGSISIIDIRGGVANITQADVNTLLFTSFNANEAALIASGVRKTKSTSTLSQDFEPEYITVSKDSKKAWVTLQENNSIAELDLETMTYTRIMPLGTKDYSAFGSGLDLSDQGGFIHIANWPLKGFYIPDAIANYTVNDVTYLITANEGDEKEYGGLNERSTVASLNLDATAFPQAAMLKENHNMGRMRVTNLNGDTDGDGDYDEIYCLGGRSFTIWNTTTGERVFDSGDDFEQITSTHPSTAGIFNSDHEENEAKGRSRSKGPEPEGVTVVPLNDRLYAFITLERIGGVMVYDVTDPEQAEFTDYINTRDAEELGGDLGPEGVIYVSHPNGDHYVLVANEVSGTIAVFKLNQITVSSEDVAGSASVQVFPNPVHDGKVYLSEPTTFSVFDINGRQMLGETSGNEFDVTNWTSGIYMIRMQTGDVQKLVVE